MFAIQNSPLFSVLPVLLCGGGMALCMWLMSRGSHKKSAEFDGNDHGLGQNARIVALEEEVRRLNNAQREVVVPPVTSSNV